MMKHIKTILLLGLFTHIPIHSLTEADWKRMNAVFISSVGVGIISSVGLGHGIAKLLVTKYPKLQYKAGIAASMAAGVPVGIGFSSASMWLGYKLVVRYIASKYGVNYRIAQLATVYDSDLNNLKDVFIAADQHNTTAVRTFLSNFFEKKYGKEWKNKVKKFIEQYFLILRKTPKTELVLSKNINQQFLKIIQEFLNPLSILYLNEPIPSWSSNPRTKEKIIQTLDQFIQKIGLFD